MPPVSSRRRASGWLRERRRRASSRAASQPVPRLWWCRAERIIATASRLGSRFRRGRPGSVGLASGRFRGLGGAARTDRCRSPAGFAAGVAPVGRVGSCGASRRSRRVAARSANGSAVSPVGLPASSLPASGLGAPAAGAVGFTVPPAAGAVGAIGLAPPAPSANGSAALPAGFAASGFAVSIVARLVSPPRPYR